MQIKTNTSSSFPDQVVPDAEKATWEYGLSVARAIEGEWFSNYSGGGYRFATNYNNFHNLRLYARGEQSIQKYKDELSINGDLSYLNLDWKPVPIIPKFVDIVVNGISQRSYEVKAFAQDPESRQKRTIYAERIIKDIQLKAFNDSVKATWGIDITESNRGENEPQTMDELSAHMQLDYKQSIEVAEEELIDQILDKNKYHLIRKRLNQDLTILGIGAVKTSFNRTNGICVEYVDPVNLVHSYTEDPNFDDLYYVGEVKSISIPELKKRFPHLSPEDMKEIQKYPGNTSYTRNWNGRQDNQSVQVIFFEYKTYTNQVFKIKITPKAIDYSMRIETSCCNWLVWEIKGSNVERGEVPAAISRRSLDRELGGDI